MDKIVKIKTNEKINAFNEKIRAGLQHGINVILGLDSSSQILFGGFELSLTSIENFVEKYNEESVLLTVISDKDPKGEFYWFFELKAAILMGSLMRMLPASKVVEKMIQRIFDDSDLDSFGEVGNQLSGILDRAFRALSKKDIHLKMDFKKYVFPQQASEKKTFLNQEDYVVLTCQATLQNFGNESISLLIPRSIYEKVINAELEIEGQDPRSILLYSHITEEASSLFEKLNTKHTRITLATDRDDILTKLDSGKFAAAGIHLAQFPVPLAVRDSIFLKRIASNRYLTKIPYLLIIDETSDETMAEFAKLNLKGLSSGSFLNRFPRWLQVIVKDPGATI